MASPAFSARRFLQSTAVYTFLNFLAPASKLLLFPLFVRVLAPEQFGLMSLTWSVVAVLALVLPLGLDAAFSRLYFDYRRNPRLLNKYLATILSAILLVGGAALLLLEWAGPWLFRLQFRDPAFSYARFGRIAVLISLATAVQGVVLAYYRNAQQPLRYLWVALSTFVLTTAGEVLAILYLRFDAEGILWVRCGAMGLVAAGVVGILSVRVGLRLSWRLLRPSLHYGLPMVVYLFFGYVYISYDRILVENYVGVAAVALFSAAMTIASVTELVANSLMAAIYPSVYAMLSARQYDAARVGMLLRLMGLAFLAVAVLILATVPTFVAHFTRPEYAVVTQLVPLLLAGLFFRYLYVVYTIPMFYLRTHVRKTVWLNAVCGVVLVAVNLVLLPRIGLWGAAAAMIAGRGAQFALAFWFYRRIGPPNGIELRLGYVLWLYAGLWLYLLATPWLPGTLRPDLHLGYLLPAATMLLAAIAVVLRARRAGRAWKTIATSL